MGTGKTALHQVEIERNYHNDKRSLLVSIDGVYETYSAVFTTAQTNNNIITPPSGRKVHVRAVFCATDATTGDVSLDFATSGKPVFRLYASVFNQCSTLNINISGDTDEPLTLNTTTGTNNVFLVVSYVIE